MENVFKKESIEIVFNSKLEKSFEIVESKEGNEVLIFIEILKSDEDFLVEVNLNENSIVKFDILNDEYLDSVDKLFLINYELEESKEDLE